MSLVCLVFDFAVDYQVDHRTFAGKAGLRAMLVAPSLSALQKYIFCPITKFAFVFREV